MVHKDPTNNLADTTDNSQKEDGAAESDLSRLQPLGKAPLGGGIPTYILGSQDKVEEFMNLHPFFRPVYKISDEDTQGTPRACSELCSQRPGSSGTY